MNIDTELLLKELIKIDSSDGTNDIVDFVSKFLGENGFNVEEQVVDTNNKNLVATIGEPKLAFAGHLDTVGFDTNAWITQVGSGPLDPVEKEGNIYGRGAVDMKGGLAAMLAAAVQAKPEGLMLLFTADEEVGFKGIDTFVEQYCGPKPELVVFGEPTDLTISNKHKGLFEARYKLRGKTGHSSRPHEGNDPKLMLLEMIELEASLKQDRYYDPSADIYPTLCVSSGQFGAQTNTEGLLYDRNRFNSIADVLEFNFDIRTTKPFEDAGGVEYVLGCIQLAVVKRGLSIEQCTVVNHKASLSIEREDLGWVESVIDRVIGDVRFTVMSGYTEAGIINHRLGIPSVNFGPGPSRCAHQTGEYVSVQSLSKARLAYGEMIKEVLEGKYENQ